MYTVEPVPRVGYIDFAHSQVSSTLHADASRNLAIIFGRVSAGPEETHEGRQACMHTSREKRRKRKRKKEMLRVRNLSECLSPQDDWTGCRSSSYVFIPFFTRGKSEKRTSRRHIANSLRKRLSPYLDDAPAGAFFIDVNRI